MFNRSGLSNCSQNTRFCVHFQYSKWDDIILGETPNAYEVFQTFLRCIRQMGGASGSIYLPLVGLSTMPFWFVVDCQIAHKMLDFGYLPSVENVMLYCKERQPLLMECFKAFLRCIWKMGGDTGSICWAPVGVNVPITTAVDSQIVHKMPVFECPLGIENGML